jgi:hypothetical protein
MSLSDTVPRSATSAHIAHHLLQLILLGTAIAADAGRVQRELFEFRCSVMGGPLGQIVQHRR